MNTLYQTTLKFYDHFLKFVHGVRDVESFPLFNHVEVLHFQEYQPVCSHNETDKTMTQVNTFASAPNVAHVHKYTHSMYEYSGTRYSKQICLEAKHLPFLNADNVGMAV